jgi:SAM-dependent methyltransferase
MYPASFGEVSFIDPRQGWDPRQGLHTLLREIYPEGLAGRSVLDCACNCGAYLFWAKELGAGECFGFDVREHWINQARFLAENRTRPSDGICFEVCDLYDLPKRKLPPFDITLFQGIFYHLPDPITGLKIAADLTKELIVINTATRNNLPDGMLAIDNEGREELNSGVYGLNWFPTGPSILTRILDWMGFTEIRCTDWKTEVPHQPSTLGRLQILASRTKGLLEKLDSYQAELQKGDVHAER